MLIERTERGLKIRTPAKLNLFLKVLGKRTDGYHQIDTIMCPVGLLDELELEPIDSPVIEFSLAPRHRQSEQVPGRGGADSSFADQHVAAIQDPACEVPAGDSNLVVRALAKVREIIGIKTSENHRQPSRPAGCRVQLTKQIPAAAGLGGGSSDAAAAIVAGLWMWSSWDRDLALQIASSLGSDIPLFLGDERNGIGLARATGRGEHVEILAKRPPLCFVISHPPVGSSTAEVYKLWRSDSPFRSSTEMLELLSHDNAMHHKPLHDTPWRGADVNALSREGEPARQLSTSQWSTSQWNLAMEPLLANALQQPASQLNPWIDQQLEWFAKLGKPAAMMSGSGSACFALCSDLDEGREIVEKMIELGMPRAYAAPAWYAASIEQQLERITSEPVSTNETR